jgi:diguanylate cyclase (GGDEF)-like protein
MPSKILVVDDEPHLEIVILQVFRKEIRNRELAFLFARNGEQALDVLAESGDVDLVLSDINMPKMSGLVLLRHLNERYPLIKTVIVTAYGDMANIRSAMNHGAFDFLNKPINFKDLKITIAKTLDHVKELKELAHERQQRYLAEKLQTMTEQMNTTLNVREVLDRFLETLAELVTFEWMAVFLERDQVLELEAFNHETVQHLRPGLVRHIFDQVSGYQRGMLGVELTATSRDELSGTLGRDVKGIVVVPLFGKNGACGMVMLGNESDESYSGEKIVAAFTLCSKAAFALENARLFERVRLLANTDGLTGLYNRRHFLEQSAKEVTRSLRYGNPLCAIMLDVDNFKALNDTHGHAAGDEVLRVLAVTLNQECRQTDLLGRFGGDEMVILLIETDAELGREIAERLRRAVEEQVFDIEGEGRIPITISMGMATLHNNETCTIEDLLRLADRRLYMAKEKGRNRVEVAGA